MKTPTSSEYALIDNKPIDQLKVTELKDELKRRRLKTGGLKDELIRRLDEALRCEMDETTVEGNNGIEEPETENVVTDAPDNVMVEQPVVAAGDAGMVASGYDEVTMGYTEKVVVEAKELVNDDANASTVETGYKDEGCKEQQSGLGNSHAFEQGVIAGTDLASEVLSDDASNQQLGSGNGPVSMEVTVTMTEEVSVVVGSEFSKEQSGLVDDPVSGDGIEGTTDGASVVMSDKVTEDFPSEKAVGGNGLVDDQIERDNVSSGEPEQSEDVTPAHDDVKLVSSVQNNQVSEVSTSLGFPVKSNISVSTDSLSFVEKTDLKDNLIADNVKLESDVTPEMVQPSSSDLVPDGGESHLRDVDKPHENKVTVQETDYSVANADMGQKNYSSELGSEKLNIDRSSGDDSMEEDGLETKPIDSNYNSEDVRQKMEKNEVTTIKAESPLATAMDTDLSSETKITPDQKNDVATLSEKRKLSDEEPVLNKPAKRQHRWKTESNTVIEPQTSHNPPPASSLEVLQSATLRRSISKSDSFGANDLPKEREVPPSMKPATNSLRVDRFLRPFTLKAVQELLAKTGSVACFWMDHIKTHCYVTYSSVEEAVETRNAVYNLQWPPNGGRQLMAEFVEPEEVKLRLEPPSTAQAPPIDSAPSRVPELSKISQPSPRQLSVRQRLAPQPGPLPPPPPPIINPVPVRGWLPPPPPANEKVTAPIVTLDDLFRKTKAIPRIYYLPLTDEEVAEKQRIKAKQ